VFRHWVSFHVPPTTWRDKQKVTFAVCHGRRPAVVLELTGQPYDRIVVTAEGPDEVVASLT
jgi:hypothetical protein